MYFLHDKRTKKVGNLAVLNVYETSHDRSFVNLLHFLNDKKNNGRVEHFRIQCSFSEVDDSHSED
jgi:hypothetical protein